MQDNTLWVFCFISRFKSSQIRDQRTGWRDLFERGGTRAMSRTSGLCDPVSTQSSSGLNSRQVGVWQEQTQPSLSASAGGAELCRPINIDNPLETAYFSIYVIFRFIAARNHISPPGHNGTQIILLDQKQINHLHRYFT